MALSFSSLWTAVRSGSSHSRSAKRLLATALLSSLAACGVTGEEGTAVFTVGSSWQPSVPIAQGSTFGVTAKPQQLTNMDKYTVRSSDTGIFKPSTLAEQFTAETPGKAYFVASAVGSADLGYWAERIIEPGVKVPKTFQLVAGSKVTLRALLASADGRSLNHANLATLTPADTSALSTENNGSPDFVVTASGGSSKVTLQAGVRKEDFQVSVVQASAVSKVEIGYGPITLDLGKVDRTQPGRPPETAEEDKGALVYFAMARGQSADGTRIYGVPAKWSVTEGSVQLVDFNNGVSEVQYFSLKPGQTAKLKVEVGAVTDEITVEY
jgi:hypothetical protein